MNKTTAINIAVGCVMASEMESRKKREIIKVLRELEEGSKPINQLVQEAHEIAVAKGWWDKPRSFGELIALIHSEASEALEEYRAGRSPDETWYEKKVEDSDHGPGVWVEHVQLTPEWKPCGIPAELADIVIRVFDVCGWYGIDLERAIAEKMAYNATRPTRHGGKVI